MPLDDRPRSCWMVGAAIETMVWSMKVIATAKIIAVRTRLFDLTPVPEPLKAFIASPGGRGAWRLGSHKCVGEGVDACEVGGQVVGETVAGGQRGRCVVRDLGLVAVGPDQDLERQVKLGQRRGGHHGRARRGA